MFRQNLSDHHGPALDAVVIPRRELLDVPFSTLTEDYRRIWRRAGRVAAHGHT
jgi:RNase P protein component